MFIPTYIEPGRSTTGNLYIKYVMITGYILVVIYFYFKCVYFESHHYLQCFLFYH